MIVANHFFGPGSCFVPCLSDEPYFDLVQIGASVCVCVCVCAHRFVSASGEYVDVIFICIIEIRERHVTAQSLCVLFQEISPEEIFNFLK